MFGAPAATLAPADAGVAPPPFPVIVGCPRSGTSLLAVMLDSHPDFAVPPETLPHYVETRYEDLVQRPEAELPRLCKFLDVEYTPAMIDSAAQGAARIARLQARLHVSGRLVTREDRTRIHENLAKPLQRDRIGVGRREMSAADRAAVERGAGPLLATLGYAVD